MAGPVTKLNGLAKSSEDKIKKKLNLPPRISCNVVAVDCEMVGCGVKGRVSVVARCSIVDYNGNIIYDSYIKPHLPIKDYRTQWSGIKPHHLSNAPTYLEARPLIKKHLSGKYVVGHDLKNDFQVLKVRPHPLLVMDTSQCVALRYLAGFPPKRKPSLRLLAGIFLAFQFQFLRSNKIK